MGVDGSTVPTLSEAPNAITTVTVKLENSNVFINDAQVTTPDLMASNGVLHIIDTVLIPAPQSVTTQKDVSTQSPSTTLRIASSGFSTSPLLVVLVTTGALTLIL